MSQFPFKQVDVFASEAFKGNPVAVVLDADSLSDQQMADFANWMNLSETAFILKPRNTQAHYRVRFFTTLCELPFAGHPSLGACHAWLGAGGSTQGSEIIQECNAGLIRIRHLGAQLAFLAPPLIRTGPLDPPLLKRLQSALRLKEGSIVHAAWVDNGAGWLAIMLQHRQQVLDLDPDLTQMLGLAVGVIAPWIPEQDGNDAQFEVRAFISGDGMPEDPATGSLNAGVAQWLFQEGLARSSYIVSQGLSMGRKGRIQIEKLGDGIWVGGMCTTYITGNLSL